MSPGAVVAYLVGVFVGSFGIGVVAQLTFARWLERRYPTPADRKPDTMAGLLQ